MFKRKHENLKEGSWSFPQRNPHLFVEQANKKSHAFSDWSIQKYGADSAAENSMKSASADEEWKSCKNGLFFSFLFNDWMKKLLFISQHFCSIEIETDEEIDA